jgi:predicted metal-dependent hydrolase
LKVKKSSCNQVSIEQNIFLVEVHIKSDASKVLHQRYLEQAKEKFLEYNKAIQKKFTHYWVSPKKLIVRRMKSRRWSCSKTWNITLNTDLVQAPRWCIEYVINHEYCHLIEFGHTKKFYELQKETMPDRSKWKNKLEKLLA